MYNKLIFRNNLCLDFFFFNDTAPTEIYTLSLHDALPISAHTGVSKPGPNQPRRSVTKTSHQPVTSSRPTATSITPPPRDRKSTRLNSSHANISYAVFCLKKKKNISHTIQTTHHLQNNIDN